MKCDVCHGDVREDCDHNQGRCPHRTPIIEVRNPSGFFFTLLSRLMLLSAGVALFMASMHPLHIAAAGFLVISSIFGIIGDAFNG